MLIYTPFVILPLVVWTFGLMDNGYAFVDAYKRSMEIHRQMNSALHVQIIRIRWTKRSRGAPAATSRAKVPWNVAGVADIKRGWLTIKTHNFGEPDFSAPQASQIELRELANSSHFEQGAFSLRWNGEVAQTSWLWEYWDVGSPEPNFVTKHLGQFEIAPDSWVRLHWQGRLTHLEGDWEYRKTIVNVARCDRNLNVDFSGKPARSFEWLPQLY